MIQQPSEAAQAAQVARPARVTLYSAPLSNSRQVPPEEEHSVAPAEARPQPGRLLALDLGAKRVGVAVSDELGLTARPLPSLPRTNWKKLLRDVAELCGRFDVKGVVVGLPLRLDGGEGEAAAEARRLARNFGLSLKCPVFLQDERLTSKEAEAALRGEGREAGEVKALVDSASAAIILRDYLNQAEEFKGKA